ncbi:phosphoribosyltransferase [Thermogladius sp. 4427co]|uniref:phosphoribosyltransferase n=1 Tax=Thermogladius sp. 4427co TaxID=3450718 RepID=UPI003F796810
MERKPELRYVSWDEIHRALAVMSKRVRESFKPDMLVAIAKGGYIPARILSDFLGISQIGLIEIKFYKEVGKTREKPVVYQISLKDIEDSNILVVDDVVDSGRTMQTALNLLSNFSARDVRSLAIYVKKWSPMLPDYYWEITDKWVVFPWEICETLRDLGDLDIKELEEISYYCAK